MTSGSVTLARIQGLAACGTDDRGVGPPSAGTAPQPQLLVGVGVDAFAAKAELRQYDAGLARDLWADGPDPVFEPAEKPNPLRSTR
jgi:hypothetical protein